MCELKDKLFFKDITNFLRSKKNRDEKYEKNENAKNRVVEKTKNINNNKFIK